MNKNIQGYDLIIPVYNEKNIIKLFDYLKGKANNILNIYICYDFENDITITKIKNSQYSNVKNIILAKNPSLGPGEAIKNGIKKSSANAVIIYPADDFNNGFLLDQMYDKFIKGYDVVCPSRFMKGGSIKECPIIKFCIVKMVSFSLYYLSKLKIKDPTNGFRLFSKKFLNQISIESKEGFSYSLELLVKAHKKKLSIIEIPCVWIERKDRKSRFKILSWSFAYLKWYFYAIFL